MNRLPAPSPTPDRFDLRTEDDPSGGTALWPRKPLERSPREAVERAVRIALWAGIAVLVVGEGMERLRGVRRRGARQVTQWWSDLERRDRTDARRVELVVLASQIRRAAGSPRARHRR